MSGFVSAADVNGTPVNWMQATWEKRNFIEIPLGALPDGLAEIRARVFSPDTFGERVILYYNLLHDFATACAHLASGGQNELPLRLVQLADGHVVRRNAAQIQAAFESQDEDGISESLRLVLEDAGYGPLKFHRVRFLDSGDIWLPARSELWL